MRHFILVLLIFNINTEFVFGQGLVQEFRKYISGDNYAQPAQYPTTGIASDFGPRHYGADGYDWHGGIDYNDPNGDRHDLILAVDYGGVYGDMLNNGTKYVLIINSAYNFYYMHLFRNGNAPLISGNCELRRADYPNDDDWAIIFGIDGVCSAITNSTDPDATVTSPYFNNGLPISAKNYVNQDYPMVGPVGNSGMSSTNPNYAVHLHLGLLEYPNTDVYNDNIAKNPLQFVSHPSPTYINNILLQNDQTRGIQILYPGDYENTIQARIEMDGQGSGGNGNYSVVMDVDKVEFKIKKASNSGDYQTVTGPYFNRIELGGTLNGVRMPNGMIGTVSVGNWSSPGIEPFAYNSDPWDDYYFADFVTRIHVNDPMDGGTTPTQIANCPDNCRYGDGAYLLKVVSTNINNVQTEGPVTNNQLDPIEFTLDNFKPYIQTVNIRTLQNNTLFYNETWSCGNNQCVSFSKNNLSTTLPGEECKSGFIITVTCSEVMENLLLSIPAYSISNKAPATVSEGSIFTFKIEANEITDLTQEVILHFSGTDKNSNQVISFSPNYAQQCVSIPTRISNTAWTDPNTPDLSYGDDDIHRFKFSCASQGGLPPGLAANEGTEVIIEAYEILLSATLTQPTNAHDCKDGAIDLKINGGFAPYEVKWYKINDNGQNEEIKKGVSQSGNDGAEDLSDLEPGKYLVEVEDALCGTVSKEFELSNCGCIVVNKLYQRNVSKCGNNLNSGVPYESCDGEIKIEVKGADQYKVEWSNGSTELEINNLCIGTYSVTVTVDDCDPIINTYEICCCTNETLVDEPYPMCDMPTQINITGADITSPSSGTAADGSIDLKVEGSNGASYKWTGPNGFTANTEDISGLTVGTYCVTITNECGGIIGNCYTLVDCSISNLTVSGTVLNTCQGYCYGAVSVNASGGNPGYRYNWSNGSTQKTLNNLCAGQYCVTVTDASGCRDEECLTVAYKQLDVTGATIPCGWQYYCNGNPTTFVPYFGNLQCYYDDPFDCTVINCYCPLTGGLNSTYYDDYLGYGINWAECALYGLCPPNGKSWQYIMEGYTYSYYTLIEADCKGCYYCVEVTVCVVGNYYKIVDVRIVDGWNCGLSETPSINNETTPVSLNFNLRELDFFIKVDSLIAEDKQLLIPKGMNEFTTINDYFEGFREMQKNGNSKIIECTPMDFNKQIKDISEISCEKICGENYYNSMIARESKTNSENKISISPNPFSGILKIYCNFVESSEIEINVINVLGEIVYRNAIENGQDYSINLNHIENGAYLIRFKQNERIIKTEKIIKQ